MVIAMAVPVAAQTDHPFDALSSVIQPLDTVIVTDVSGQTLKGQVRSLTKTTIEVFDRDDIVRSFDRDRIQRIIARDPIGNGASMGALIGAIPMLVGGLVINGGCMNEGGMCGGVILGLTGLGAAIGAGIGAAADAAVQRVVYDQPATSSGPVTRGTGARMSVRVTPTRASVGMSYGW
jgi:hypothetical protein